ncbi:hypothetical protein [Vacuolonema iberomarrocanum]|uniref:hypothetical protein n=1 Tax=Vacuolonema iberomarrocanum TaxID=3454632 RepID=UPI003F6E0E4B
MTPSKPFTVKILPSDREQAVCPALVKPTHSPTSHYIATIRNMGRSSQYGAIAPPFKFNR